MKKEKEQTMPQSPVEIKQKALESINDPKLHKLFESILERTTIEKEAMHTAEGLKSQIPTDAKTGGAQMWLPVCPMPTDLCRVSPFFPMNRNNLKDRSFIEDMVIMKSAWGEIQFYGPKLSTYEEDVLMAILALLNNANKRSETAADGKSTYTYNGPFYPLLKLIKGNKPNKIEYKRVHRALKLLNVSGFNLILLRDNKIQKEQLSNILTYAEWDHENKELKITINPYFYEIYMKGNFTLIEIEQRMRLKSPIAKALHRFILSHRDNTWQGHFITLSASLNLNLEQTHFHIRRDLKEAVRQLIKESILSKESKFISQDIIKLVRKIETTERKKALKK